MFYSLLVKALLCRVLGYIIICAKFKFKMPPMIGGDLNLHWNYLSGCIAIGNGSSCVKTTWCFMSSRLIKVWVTANSTFTTCFIILITKSSTIVSVVIIICWCIKSISPSRSSWRRVGESTVTWDKENLFKKRNLLQLSFYC